MKIGEKIEINNYVFFFFLKEYNKFEEVCLRFFSNETIKRIILFSRRLHKRRYLKLALEINF